MQIILMFGTAETCRANKVDQMTLDAEDSRKSLKVKMTETIFVFLRLWTLAHHHAVPILAWVSCIRSAPMHRLQSERID